MVGEAESSEFERPQVQVLVQGIADYDLLSGGRGFVGIVFEEDLEGHFTCSRDEIAISETRWAGLLVWVAGLENLGLCTAAPSTCGHFRKLRIGHLRVLEAKVICLKPFLCELHSTIVEF